MVRTAAAVNLLSGAVRRCCRTSITQSESTDGESICLGFAFRLLYDVLDHHFVPGSDVMRWRLE